MVQAVFIWFGAICLTGREPELALGCAHMIATVEQQTFSLSILTNPLSMIMIQTGI